MKTVAFFIAFVLLACATARSVKTPASMLAYRLTHNACEHVCPIGQAIKPVEPQAEHVLADCCVDPFGVGWSSCAWNAGGRYTAYGQFMEPARLAGDCGGDGYPDCGASE